MKNPGLDVFARAYVHPGMEDIRDPEDPDYQDPEDEDAWGEFTRGHSFGRWREPGSSIRVPTKVGPSFKPGDTPENVIHGEVVTQAEQDSADHILKGDHDSEHPSANPFVEHARQDLHTPSSSDAVATLSGLLRGGTPDDVGGLDEAHDYLRHHFTGVRVNPHHGTLLAASPAGMQLVRRHEHLPAIPEKPAVKPTYSLTNKHGIFESQDPQRLVRAMVAFQIVHNEIAMEQAKKKKEDDDDQGQVDSSLTATSGLMDFVGDMADRFHSRRTPPPAAPEGAVFEPGRGIEKNDKGQAGGYVMPADKAPSDWWRSRGTAYSPGHHMRLMYDPHEAVQPRNDPRFPGHTFTYAPNIETGHVVPRRLGNVNYFVQDKTHPAARGDGFDLIPVPKATTPTTRAPRAPGSSSRMPKKGPRVPPHEPPRSLPPAESAVKSNMNDLCPVCTSGYLEPYDAEFHECLNCGSLVKHVGFEKEAAARRKPGGLGRGLGDIIPYTDDPLKLSSGGSDDPDFEAPLGTFAHPLAGEVAEDPEEPTYQAPKRILDKKAAESDPLDEHLGKLDFFPIHKPGQERAYLKPMEDLEGSYWRLTEGAPHPKTGQRGWALTADHIPSVDQWEVEGEPHRGRGVNMAVDSTNPDDRRYRRHTLPDLGERPAGEKSFIAGGTHPIDDDSLNRAIKDVHINGRNSATYQNAVLNTAYEPQGLPPEVGTQQQKARYSSVGNPGLARFVS